MFDVMVLAYGTGDENLETFVKFLGGLFVGMGGFAGISESDNMDRVPKEWPPCFRRYMHF
jgi:hypothetical protein